MTLFVRIFDNRKRFIWITLVVSIALGVLAALFVTSVSHSPPGYVSFTRYRSQKYYSRFADGCDLLIAQVKSKSLNDGILSGNDPRLPPILRKLYASNIEVRTNHVWLTLDDESGYGVMWEEDEYRPHVWKLTVYSESAPFVVFERKVMGN